MAERQSDLVLDPTLPSALVKLRLSFASLLARLGRPLLYTWSCGTCSRTGAVLQAGSRSTLQSGIQDHTKNLQGNINNAVVHAKNKTNVLLARTVLAFNEPSYKNCNPGSQYSPATF